MDCALSHVRVLMVTDFANTSSDADSDVLADYVLALIRADSPDEDLKKNAAENLEDFLRDSMFSKPSSPCPNPSCLPNQLTQM